jgi:glutathione S-transferase
MTIQLYIDYLCQPSRAVYIFCRLNSIPISVTEMSIASKDQRQPWFLLINSFHKLPTIVDKNITLFESQTILRYLANTYLPPSNPYYPRNDPALQSEIESLFAFYYKRIRFIVLPQLLAHFQGIYKFDMRLYDEAKIGTQVRGVLGEIDCMLQGREYLTSSGRMTVADVLIFCEVVQLE